MFDFLRKNIACKKVYQEPDRSLIVKKRNATYWIRAFSRIGEVKPDFHKDPTNFDEDRRYLQTLYDEMLEVITQTNQKGLIPGFVFLKSVPDRKNLGTGKRVNDSSFGKQYVQGTSRPWNDMRQLSPLEVVIQQFNGHHSKTSNQSDGKMVQKRWKGKIRIDDHDVHYSYFPELAYYNPKKNQLEINYYAKIADTLPFKRDTCPVCVLDNSSDHQACKRSREYVSWVKERTFARYVRRERQMRIRPAQRDTSVTGGGIDITFGILDSATLPNISERLRITYFK